MWTGTYGMSKPSILKLPGRSSFIEVSPHILIEGPAVRMVTVRAETILSKKIQTSWAGSFKAEDWDCAVKNEGVFRFTTLGPRASPGLLTAHPFYILPAMPPLSLCSLSPGLSKKKTQLLTYESQCLDLHSGGRDSTLKRKVSNLRISLSLSHCNALCLTKVLCTPEPWKWRFETVRAPLHASYFFIPHPNKPHTGPRTG